MARAGARRRARSQGRTLLPEGLGGKRAASWQLEAPPDRCLTLVPLFQRRVSSCLSPGAGCGDVGYL